MSATGVAWVKRTRVLPTADTYPITCLLKLPQQTCQASRPKALQISSNVEEASIGLPPCRTAHCSPLSSAGWAVHGTMPPARPGSRQPPATPTASKQNPFFSSPRSLPWLQKHRSWALSQHRAEARAAPYHSKGKHHVVAVEAAALQLPVHIPAQQPGANEGL